LELKALDKSDMDVLLVKLQQNSIFVSFGVPSLIFA